MGCGTVLLPGRLDLVLLPGGEFVISIDEGDSTISLHRIKLSGKHLSLIRLTDLSRGERDKGEVAWNKMLPAMAPNPVFSYARTNRSVRAPAELKPSGSDFERSWKSSVYLFGISPDGGVKLETEFPIPNRSNLLWVNGQGRVAGFVFQTNSESPVVTIVHLDRPGVTMKIRLPPDCGELNKDLFLHEPRLMSVLEKMKLLLHLEGSWKVCFPIPDFAVICGRDRVLAYTLPPFSTLPHGEHLLDEDPTWRLSNIMEDNTGGYRNQTSAEVFYDPSLSDSRYNIHFWHQLDSFDLRKPIELITLIIDPSNPSSSSSGTPAYQRIENHFSTYGLIAGGSLHQEIYHSRTRSHSEGLDVWVTSLEDISFGQGRGEEERQGSLHMFVSNDEFEPDLEWESVDVDEASGRVFIWGPTYQWMTPSETRVFVGELVS